MTEEYLKKFDRMNFLDKEIHKLEYDILPGIKLKAENAFNEKIEAQTVLDGEKFDLNAAYELFQRLKHKLAEMIQRVIETLASFMVMALGLLFLAVTI